LWRVTTSRTGRRQTRANFTLAGPSYDLSVTDPIWEHRLRDLPNGVHERTAAGIETWEEVFLTISLGEPFYGSCYKLVATVIAI
jgi:hypothetical protein